MARVRDFNLKTKIFVPLVDPKKWRRRLASIFTGVGGHDMQKVRSTKEYRESLVEGEPRGTIYDNRFVPKSHSFPGVC